MICPKCGHEQPEAEECQRCGVIIARAIIAAQHPSRSTKPAAHEPDPKEQLQALIDDLQRAREHLERQARALWSTRPPSVESRIDFYREMSQMLHAGLPLSECLDALTPNARRGGMAPVIEDLQRETKEDAALWEAMETLPHAFSTLECTLVELGLRTNQVRPVFKRLIAHLGQSRDALESVVGARPFSFARPVALALLFALITPLYQLQDGLFFVAEGSAGWIFFLGLSGVTLFMGWLWCRQRPAISARIRKQLSTLAPLRRAFAARRYRDFFLAMRVALSCGMAPNNAVLLAVRASGDPVLTKQQTEVARAFAEGRRIGDVLTMLPDLPETEIALLSQGDIVGDIKEPVLKCADLFTSRWRRTLQLWAGGALLLAALLTVAMGVRSGLVVAEMWEARSSQSASVVPKTDGVEGDDEASRAEMERAAESIEHALPGLKANRNHDRQVERATHGM